MATPLAWSPCRHVRAMLAEFVLFRHVMMVRNNVLDILIHGRDVFHKKVDNRGQWNWGPMTNARSRRKESQAWVDTSPKDWDNWRGSVSLLM